MIESLLTSPVTGSIVLALLLLVLARRSFREASERRPHGGGWAIALLLAVFVANVVARFVHG
jgi:hypothetical protein